MRKVKEMGLACILIVGTAIGISIMLSNLEQYYRYAKVRDYAEYKEEEIRDLLINDELIAYLYETSAVNKTDVIQEITIRMMLSDYDLSDYNKWKTVRLKDSYVEKLKYTPLYQSLYPMYQMIFSDLKYFPIPVDLANNEYVRFDDSWMTRRTYGGERKHEGTDIMPSKKESGYFPVLSITDGVIEKKGWLEKGGYRIGVRSPSGGYFYYAHLHSYADGIQVGDEIHAGELLGFMGDTGYSKVEGTTGNFAVHLHFGIYLFDENVEISVNPYWVLKYLERHRLEYYFSAQQ